MYSLYLVGLNKIESIDGNSTTLEVSYSSAKQLSLCLLSEQIVTTSSALLQGPETDSNSGTNRTVSKEIQGDVEIFFVFKAQDSFFCQIIVCLFV